MEPAPKPSEGDLWADLIERHEAVLEQMRARRQFGIDKYNTPLQPFNGRRFWKDFMEELYDAIVYMEGEVHERRVIAKRVIDVVFDIAQAMAEDGLEIDDFCDYLAMPKTQEDIIEEVLK